MIKEVILSKEATPSKEDTISSAQNCWRNQWRNCWKNCWKNCWRNVCPHK